jgi:hypothetical protein
MRAFEIHTYTDGKWKVDSVFDDRDLAVHEARKVDENGRYAGVRVIEENYDESTDFTTTRTIFRGKNQANKSKSSRPTAKKSSREGRHGGGERERRGKGRVRPQKKKSGGVLVPVLILCLLVISGVAMMFGLHYVGGVK